jgi:hypothetical protein
MKEATMPDPKHIEATRPLIVGAFALLASACAGDVVELGEDASSGAVPSATSRCRSSTTLSDVGKIVRQADLDQLAGCEEIDGDLEIGPIPNPDFTPLASLRVVTGFLTLGATGQSSSDPPYTPPPAETDALIEAGWLDSLEGLENIERVGSLGIAGISAPDLEPLSNLRALTTGAFAIGGCTGLKDLTGLEGMAGLTNGMFNCDSLQSLQGLSFPQQLDYLTIHGARLKDLGSVRDVSMVDYLEISNTALENVDGLAGLGLATTVTISSNPELRNVAGIASTSVVEWLTIESNGLLEALPAMQVAYVHHLIVRDNAALRQWPTFDNTLEFFQADAQNPRSSAVDLITFRENTVEVSGNPRLESVALPPGWQGAEYISIENNAALGSIDFSTAKNVTELTIANNAVLAHAELGALDTVNALRVTGNPLLPLTDFDGVRTFDRQMSTEPAPGISPP